MERLQCNLLDFIKRNDSHMLNEKVTKFITYQVYINQL